MPLHMLLLACLAITQVAAADAAVTAAVPDAPAGIRPLLVGSAVPRQTQVRRPDGSATNLGAVLAGKPSVVIFYRGGWCPFCTRHLAGLAKAMPGLTAAGWQIVAVSPDRPAGLVAAQPPQHEGLTLLSDADGDLMRAFGVAYRVDDVTVDKLREHRIDLAAASGNDHRWLPVPTVALIAADGKLRFIHADPDYRVRLAPEALLAIAASLDK